jgi:multicomponent Na+:H+ antiporter subunit C
VSLAYAVAAWLLIVGIVGMVTSRNLIHLILCLVVVQSSTYVLLLAVGYRTAAHAPVQVSIASSAPQVDPVVQAMVLTDIVVEATVTALLLSLAVLAHKRFHTLDPHELRSLEG